MADCTTADTYLPLGISMSSRILKSCNLFRGSTVYLADVQAVHSGQSTSGKQRLSSGLSNRLNGVSTFATAAGLSLATARNRRDLASECLQWQRQSELGAEDDKLLGSSVARAAEPQEQLSVDCIRKSNGGMHVEQVRRVGGRAAASGLLDHRSAWGRRGLG